MATVKRNNPLPPETVTVDSTIEAKVEPGGAAFATPSGDLYMDPVIEGLLPWGPLEDYTARGGRKMKVRRARDIGGQEAFWRSREADKDRHTINGVRVWAQKDREGKEIVREDGKRVWDAVWYIPSAEPKLRAASAPRRSAPRPPMSAAAGTSLVVAVALLMKRLSTTKAVEFDEYKAVEAALRAPVTPVLEEI